ncbi:MAG: winged helix-turn-helix domain-containing protein [Bacteroidales bacterium]|nr:winged helix-turn-helix domain-containing protein [Bacteroidales bacterium]
MLEALITSRTRIKMLLKFFLNSRSEAYLRSLEQEFGESANAIRMELNKFEHAGLLKSLVKGNKKYYQANTKHPLFSDIHSIIMKYVGLDKIIENVVEKLGDVKKVYLVGDFARGKDAKVIDLIFVGEDIKKQYLLKLIDKAESLIERHIRYLVFSQEEFDDYMNTYTGDEPLLLWEQE